MKEDIGIKCDGHSLGWFNPYRRRISQCLINILAQLNGVENENTNSLIRQYLHKSTDFRDVLPEKLEEIIYELNNRPRKNLATALP